MITGVLLEHSLRGLAHALASVDTSLYQMLELRLDACRDFSLDTFDQFAALPLPLPCIFTLRRKEEGGFFAQGEGERLRLLSRLARLKPAWLDIEAAVPAEQVLAIRKESPETRILLSSHDFAAMPPDIDGWYQRSRKTVTSTAAFFPAEYGDPEAGVVYKLAGTARSTLDALRMLEFCKGRGNRVLGIAMGEEGECTRILAPAAHCGLCYCPVAALSAPGQLTAETLRSLYNAERLDKDTRLYGLLGDPVAQSTGHVFHNAMNRDTGENAVYVKLRLAPADLPAALPLLHKTGFAGLSVTMPHKQTILPLLAGCSPAVERIGAANTLIWQPGGYYGENTDGPGAVEALGAPLAGTTVGILGAGGSARSIIHAVAQEARKVLVFNRSTSRTLPADAPVFSLDDLPDRAGECDILINTLPFTANLSFRNIPFHSGMLVMDISYGSESAFLAQAKACGCEGVDGLPMFRAQARLQRRLWSLSY